MEKKDIRKYIICIAVIFLVSALIPAAIRYATDLLVGQIRQETISESEKERENARKMSVTLPDLNEKEQESDKVDSNKTEELPDQSEEDANAEDSYDKKLEIYREKMSPTLSEIKEGAADAFVGDREQQFFTAVADYIFSLYGDRLSVTRIDVVELVKDNETELVYQIEVFASDGSKEYSELFISSYNKEWDFYSIYSYSVQ